MWSTRCTYQYSSDRGHAVELDAIPHGPRVHRRFVGQTRWRLVQPAESRRRPRSGRRVCQTESQRMIPSIVLLGNLLVDDVVHADAEARLRQWYRVDEQC